MKLAFRHRRIQVLTTFFILSSLSFLLFVLRCGSDIDVIGVTLEASSAKKRFSSGVQLTSTSSDLKLDSVPRLFDSQELSQAKHYQDGQQQNNPEVTLPSEIIIQNNVELLLKSPPLNNEFEVSPFIRFTIDRLYPVEPGLGRRVIEKPIGFRKREILDVLDHALHELNKDKEGQKNFSLADFIEGIYQTVPGAGTQYKLYFRDGVRYRRMTVLLPYSMPVIIKDDQPHEIPERIHMILALSQRTVAFRRFLDQFEQMLTVDSNIHLTVVYFGQQGLLRVREMIANCSMRLGKGLVSLIEAPGSFSRARGLQIGADSVVGNALLFMCDVDVVFLSGFLERCRLHAIPSQSVYYPIVFSLYNPDVVSLLSGSKMTLLNQITITRDNGFWRDFGYGMTCQYRFDFKRVGGFDTDASSNGTSGGWGMEDVRLYRRHLQSSVAVVRATDPGIFHIWHEKHCESNLSPSQLVGCLRSRALAEASHAQLGMLFLRERALHSHSKSKP